MPEPDQGLGDTFARAAYGTGSPAEMAGQPSGIANILGAAFQGLKDLSQRAVGASEQLRTEGTYNPAPAFEAAQLTMGGPLIGNLGRAAGEAVLGSGPTILRVPEHALSRVPRANEGLITSYRNIEDVPMDWMQRLPGNDLRSEAKVRELMRLIEQEGLKDPLIINVGKNSGTAMLGEGNHRLNALYRMGFDTAPARTIVGSEYGSRYLPHSNYREDLIPKVGEYFSSDAAPSEVFRSLAGIGG